MNREPPFQTASKGGLAKAVQDKLFALFQAIASSLPDAEIVETPGISCHHSFPTNPMFKGVWRTRLSPDEADEKIDGVVAWHSANRARRTWHDGRPFPLERKGYAADSTRFYYRGGTQRSRFVRF